MIPQMFKGLFKRNRKSGPSSFLDLDEDIVSTDFECSLESLTFSSTCEDVFLDRFNHSRTLELIKESGILPALNENGFKNVVLDIFKDDTGVHHLKIYADTKKRATLVDLRLSFKNVYRADLQNPMKIDFRKHNFSVLNGYRENPRKSFSEESRPLRARCDRDLAYCIRSPKLPAAHRPIQRPGWNYNGPGPLPYRGNVFKIRVLHRSILSGEDVGHSP